MTFKTGLITAAAAAAALLLANSAGYARSLAIEAQLKPSSEVPPTTATGNGELKGTYDTDTKALTYTVTYSGLTGPATAAHLHAPAATGSNAGVEVPVSGALTSPITVNMTLTADQAKNLTDGMTYFNIHTVANKGGEMRGQISVGK